MPSEPGSQLQHFMTHRRQGKYLLLHNLSRSSHHRSTERLFMEIMSRHGTAKVQKASVISMLFCWFNSRGSPPKYFSLESADFGLYTIWYFGQRPTYRQHWLVFGYMVGLVPCDCISYTALMQFKFQSGQH